MKRSLACKIVSQADPLQCFTVSWELNALTALEGVNQDLGCEYQHFIIDCSFLSRGLCRTKGVMGPYSELSIAGSDDSVLKLCMQLISEVGWSLSYCTPVFFKLNQTGSNYCDDYNQDY